MTWWRTARDSSGMTVVERLEFQKDCWESGSIAWQRERGKRIRSILRRLKICPVCRGTRWRLRPTWIDEERNAYECMACLGSGRIRREG